MHSQFKLAQQAAPSGDVPPNVLEQVTDVMTPLASYQLGSHYVVEGPLQMAPEVAFEEFRRRFEGSGWRPILQQSEAGRPMLLLAAADAFPVQRRDRPWLNALLLVATLVTTTWVGAALQGINLTADPGRFTAGMPYAFSLMLILGAHELGHYFTARRYGMAVSLPYFIPVPFMLGTFGAFIRMKSFAPNRKALFDVAVAGPLAGLLVAVPALLVGLQYSTVVPDAGAPTAIMGGADVGSSALLAFLARAALGEAVIEGHRLVLSPVAFAGWLGLWVTALNLFPVGQLDGGHLVHALLGPAAARRVGIAALATLVLLGLFVWPVLLTWALLIFFIAGTTDAPPLNGLSPVGRGRWILGALVFALLLLIILPLPGALYSFLGLHAPSL